MQQSVVRGVEPLDQRRVSVVCRSTRVDVSLPAHLELVAVIPEVVDLVRDHVRALAGPGTAVDVDARMGGAAGGSWQLSRLAGDALSVSETLSQQRVHDGEILVLDHRPVPTPPPLFDDVLQGLTEPGVAGERDWGRRQTRVAATAAVALSALCAAAALLVHWGSLSGVLPAALSAVLAVVALVGVVAARSGRAGVPAELTATACATGFTSLAAATAVPGAPGAGHVLAGATAGAVVAVCLRVVWGRPRLGDEPATALGALCLAWASAAACAAVAALVVATTDLDASRVGAAAVVPGMLLLTAAPRLAVAAARVPIPPVPVPGDARPGPDAGMEGDPAGGHPDGTADGSHAVDPDWPPALPTPEALRSRALATRAWLTGLLGGAGAIVVGGALVALTGPPEVTAWAAPLAAVLVPVLLLRGSGYADRLHVGLLVGWALVLVTGVLLGAVLTVDGPAGIVVAAASAVAATAVAVGLVVPRDAPSPVVRRSVATLEAVLVASVVPVALGATGLFSLIRHR